MSRSPSPLMSPSAAVVMISAPGCAGSLQLLREARQRVAARRPRRRRAGRAPARRSRGRRRRPGRRASGEAMKPRLMWLLRVRSCGRDERPGRCRTGKPGTTAAVGLPGVHVLARRVDDLGLQVAVDVADRGRAQHLARRVDLRVGGRARVHVRVEARAHRLAVVEARERRAVGLQHAQLAARVRQHGVERVVAVQVEQPLARPRRRCRGPCAPALVQRGVAVGEQHLAVLGAVARGVGDDHAHREGGLVRVLVARALGGRGRVGGGAAAGARVERGAHRGQVDRCRARRRSARCALCVLTSWKSASAGSMPGAHWSLQV